jgi:hypothetical protein
MHAMSFTTLTYGDAVERYYRALKHPVSSDQLSRNGSYRNNMDTGWVLNKLGRRRSRPIAWCGTRSDGIAGSGTEIEAL